ncbi:MAG: Nif3-like dinuclear metal center hexameric protein, partial [Bifidobacteriaceae bacterium]|nr:Nif3-like dinuclear metal center hexameric protein [Bifidobacteriaceae bacterium]
MELKTITEFLAKLYPEQTAEPYDFPGLIVGSPNWQVNKVLFAVDPTQ